MKKIIIFLILIALFGGCRNPLAPRDCDFIMPPDYTLMINGNGYYSSYHMGYRISSWHESNLNDFGWNTMWKDSCRAKAVAKSYYLYNLKNSPRKVKVQLKKNKNEKHNQ